MPYSPGHNSSISLNTCLRIVEGWQCLDEVQVAVALQLEDAKGQTHPNSERGPTLLGGTVGGIITQIKQVRYSWPPLVHSYGIEERTKNIGWGDTIPIAEQTPGTTELSENVTGVVNGSD